MEYIDRSLSLWSLLPRKSLEGLRGACLLSSQVAPPSVCVLAKAEKFRNILQSRIMMRPCHPIEVVCMAILEASAK